MKQLFYLTATLLLVLLTSCNQDDSDIMIPGEVIQNKNNRLHFDSSESLNDFLKNETNENFEQKVIQLQKNKFSPLVPIFEKGDDASKQQFLKKKLNRMNKDYKFAGIPFQQKLANLDDEDLDDELIVDDKFAALLDENRGIYVGEHLYIYTTEGIFKVHQNNEEELLELLDAYLESGVIRNQTKNPNGLPLIPEMTPCDENKPIPFLSNEKNASLANSKRPTSIQLTKNIEILRPYNSCGGNPTGPYNGGGTGTGTGSTTNGKAYPFNIKQNLGTCVIRGESIWQQIFGEAETCHDYYDSGRRVKTKFWNQNYVVFSSIGASVKHQKKNWGIWDKSDATDFVELGINNATWTYEFESSHLNQIYNNYATNTLIRYKGKTYNINGQVLNDYPISVPNWPFNSDAPIVDGLEIYLFGNNILSSVNNFGQANKLIRDTAKDFIVKFGNSLETQAVADKINVSGVVADPMNRKLTFTVIGRIERDHNDCCAYHYFDWNAFVSTKFNIETHDASCSGDTCTSAGYNLDGIRVDVFNAKDYKDLTIDLYGLARRDGNNYKGKRLVTENVLPE